MSRARSVFIGVNYGTPNLAARFVSQVTALKYSPSTTILVNNSPDEGHPNDLRNLDAPRFIYVPAGRNLGYLNGAELGLMEFFRRQGEFEWLVVANVDLDFRDPAFLAGLEAIDGMPNVGIVAPAIWSDPILRNLNPYMLTRPNRKRIRFYTLLYRSVIATNAYILAAQARAMLPRLTRKNVVPDKRIKRIYAAHGSCLVFSRAYFERGGTLKYPSFLFGEEIHLAERTSELGLQVIYNPLMNVWHAEHSSTGLFRSSVITRYQLESAKFLADRYFA